MLRKISNNLFPLTGFDEKVRLKRSLGLILPISLLIIFFYGSFFLLQNPADDRKWLIFATSVLTILSWGLTLKDNLRFSALTFVIGLWVIISVGVFYSGGILSIGYSAFLLIIFMAGLLLGARYAFLLLLLSTSSTVWIMHVQLQGKLPPAPPPNLVELWLLFTLYLVTGWILLSLTMRQMWTALHNSSRELEERRQTEAALSKQAEYLAALHETTLSIVEGLDLNSVLESILIRAESLAETPHGYVDLILPGGRLVRQHLGHGIFEGFMDLILPVEYGMAGDVVAKGETVLIENYNNWEKKLPEYTGRGFYAILGIPLKTQGNVIGVLGLAYENPEAEFTPQRIQQLSQLAELANLVLENASLYQAVQDELSERVRTENALRESQSRLNLALSAANMGIWDWEIDQDQISWSERAYEICGLEKEDFQNNLQSFLSVVHPNDRLGVSRSLENYVSGVSAEYHIVHRIIWKSGEIRWIETQGQIDRDQNNKPVRMAGILTDITERKQNEQTIWEANHNLKIYTEKLEKRSGLLQLAAEVARAATAILDSRVLSQQVVDILQQRFELYYTGLFFIEEDPDWAILRAATGPAGQKMLDANHRLEVGGSSMIGWCIANRQARIALDVGDDAVHFSNPFLPETRSELALPLVSRGEVLGGLTFQSEKPSAFNPEAISTFKTMADLLANAILNARLYDQVQRELEERKRAEEKVRQLNVELESRVRRRTAALKASEEKFRALAENNPLQITRYDRNARYLYVNHLISINKTIDPSQAIGKTLREVFGPQPTIIFAEEKIRQVFDTGQPLKTEYEFFNFVGFWSLAPEFDPQGNVVSVISTTLDITDRKKTEEELRLRSAELQAANNELEAFSYSVSHDLRAPLRAVDGFTRILMDDFAAHIPAEGIVFLQRTRQAAQNMGQLIDDLLRLSRITRAELHRQTVDLHDLCVDICEQLKAADPNRNLKIIIAKNLKTHGDERLIRVALENMLNNAWKFTAKSPHAIIRVGKTEQNGKSVFFISDNGVGFNMNYVEKLFGPFQRLHNADEFPGTGIGLAIVKRIIYKHGGTVWPESEPGTGTKFYFTFE